MEIGQLEFWLPDHTGVCEQCREVTGLQLSPTGSVAEGATGMWLCEPCDKEHREYWDEVWSEYYSSQGM